MKCSELTPRRQQIVRLIRDGLSDKEIAVKLNIEPQSVRNIIHAIFQQTGTNSKIALLNYFYESKEKPA